MSMTPYFSEIVPCTSRCSVANTSPRKLRIQRSRPSSVFSTRSVTGTTPADGAKPNAENRRAIPRLVTVNVPSPPRSCKSCSTRGSASHAALPTTSRYISGQGEAGVERVAEDVDVVLGGDQRRSEANDVAEQAALADQHAALAGLFEHAHHGLRRRLLGLAVFH